MTSSSLTHRRRNARRPPVCKKTPPVPAPIDPRQPHLIAGNLYFEDLNLGTEIAINAAIAAPYNPPSEPTTYRQIISLPAATVIFEFQYSPAAPIATAAATIVRSGAPTVHAAWSAIPVTPPPLTIFAGSDSIDRINCAAILTLHSP